jgi:DinB superfamily
MYQCDDCEFAYDLTKASESGAAIVEGAASIARALRDTSIDVKARREPSTWSPLEYGCHLRDVLLVQRERVLAARREDCPSFPPMGRDERAEHDGYAEQDPARVAEQLNDAALMFANVLARLGPDDWDRKMIYNYPTVTERSMQWVAVHTEHEARHHLLDVNRQLT